MQGSNEAKSSKKDMVRYRRETLLDSGRELVLAIFGKISSIDSSRSIQALFHTKTFWIFENVISRQKNNYMDTFML